MIELRQITRQEVKVDARDAASDIPVVQQHVEDGVELVVRLAKLTAARKASDRPRWPPNFSLKMSRPSAVLCIQRHRLVESPMRRSMCSTRDTVMSASSCRTTS